MKFLDRLLNVFNLINVIPAVKPFAADLDKPFLPVNAEYCQMGRVRFLANIKAGKGIIF